MGKLSVIESFERRYHKVLDEYEKDREDTQNRIDFLISMRDKSNLELTKLIQKIKELRSEMADYDKVISKLSERVTEKRDKQLSELSSRYRNLDYSVGCKEYIDELISSLGLDSSDLSYEVVVRNFAEGKILDKDVLLKSLQNNGRNNSNSVILQLSVSNNQDRYTISWRAPLNLVLGDGLELIDHLMIVNYENKFGSDVSSFKYVGDIDDLVINFKLHDLATNKMNKKEENDRVIKTALINACKKSLLEEEKQLEKK